MGSYSLRTTPRMVAAGSVLLALSVVGPKAHSQTALPDPNRPAGRPPVSGQVARPPGGVPRGVVVPRAGVDPGMRVMAPHMPPQSTPVIRPGRTGPDADGVVVPR